MKTILALKAVIILMATLLCASASAQQKNLSCLLISVDAFPEIHGEEIHVTLDEANSQAKTDDTGHDDGNFHPARFTPTRVTWVGGQIVIGGRLHGPLTYDLSRTTGKMLVNDNHHYQCEVAQQKF
jgi:hypothetical protein